MRVKMNISDSNIKAQIQQGPIFFKLLRQLTKTKNMLYFTDL